MILYAPNGGFWRSFTVADPDHERHKTDRIPSIRANCRPALSGLLQLFASPDLHDRVAFLLPNIPVRLKSLRCNAYLENPTTLGQHLLRRRLQEGKFQRDAAAAIGVDASTYLLWERGRTEPKVRHYPAIFRFLGYAPFPAPTTLGGRIIAKRRELGLSIKEAADRLQVDEGTFSRWETGEWKPRMSQAKVDRFLAITPADE